MLRKFARALGATLALAAAVQLLLCSSALAAPNSGDRAGNLSGYDAVSKKKVSLAGNLGHWVLVDFWASWCGPCMRELPNLLASTAALRKNGKLKLMSVSLDSAETLDDMHKVIKEQKLTYPVIYDGAGWDAVQAREWGIEGIPASFLVNPQGVIVATNLRGEGLKDLLEYFVNQQGDNPAITLSPAVLDHQAGQPLAVHFAVSNPRHSSLKFKVDYAQYVPIYAVDDPDHHKQPVDVQENEPDPHGPEFACDIDCSNWGEGVHDVSFPLDPGALSIRLEYFFQLPDSVDAAHPDGLWLGDYYQGPIELAAGNQPAGE